ncbi:antitoxin of toxin-antitoxin stability system [Cupriavidus necator]
MADQTRAIAKALGQKTSDYVRDAVREKNEREMAARIAMLSRKLRKKNLESYKTMDTLAADGLD